MRALLVAPVEEGAGETTTAIHIAEELLRRGHAARFAAAPFAARLAEGAGPWPVERLGPDRAENRARLRALARGSDLVLFCDHHLLGQEPAVSPLAGEGWEEELEGWPARLATLDHFGLGRRGRFGFVGPPHLGVGARRVEPLPARMAVLRPVPMLDPDTPGAEGIAFRHRGFPPRHDEAAAASAAARFRRSPGELVVLHLVPRSACGLVRRLGLALHAQLDRLLRPALAAAGRPVTVAALNDGGLLAEGEAEGVRVLNLADLPKAEFDALLLGADLVCSENRVSISLGWAGCAGRPAAGLANSWRLLEIAERAEPHVRAAALAMERARPGSVFPWEVYPTTLAEDLAETGLDPGNRVLGTAERLELFGGAALAEGLSDLLRGGPRRAAQRARQEAFARRAAALPTAAACLEALVEKGEEAA